MTRQRFWNGTLLFSCLLPLLGCHPDENVHHARFLAFGTLMDLTIAGVSEHRAEHATQALEADFQQMHRIWHAWDPGPLGRVNRLLPEGDYFSAPPSVLPLVEVGQTLSRQSSGLFNPAIGRLIDLWGFHRDDPAGSRPPPDDAIQALVRQAPSMDQIELDGIRMRGTNPALKLDFGAYGKGYGIDMAVSHLRQLGIANAIINAGGDLRAIGSRQGVPWRIAIRAPSGKGVIGTIQIERDESVFTSGDYERNFTWKGKRYHHIIDPRTGYPAEGSASVTVIHSDSTTADAAATALFIAGPDEWHTIAKNMGLKLVLLIDQDGVLHMNPAMRHRLEIQGEGHSILLSPPLSPTPDLSHE